MEVKKIAISGATGKMGRVIASIIKARNDCLVICGIDKLNPAAYSDFPVYENFTDIEAKPDVIIDFSHPSGLDSILNYCLTTGTPAVLATTGYSSDQIQKIEKASVQIPLFFTFNMSLGINLLVNLAQDAAEILGEDFDVEIIEKHHNQKIDSPSGTALMLADAVNKVRGGKMINTYDRYAKRKKRDANEIGISSLRGGTIVGEHELCFCGRDEVITLKHEAYSKEVFAVGAVNAALFLCGQCPGMYDMGTLIHKKKHNTSSIF
ncbi:MAG: 4-hydroxy-tetrahydrodipicolinate reductase [Ruminococcus sp.]|jgi:4-hydroxy-tetrahydrodipicolinate reductase|nr:4-hydroxy-tetrahydrodipicolinate reductase [Ruminococcus sp.]